MKLLLLLDRIKEKIKNMYQKEVFKEKISCPHSDFNLIGGGITLINRNIKMGKNVNIYPGVMFWGDGIIDIGNNVDIGKDTIIYASKSGGVSIGDNTVIAGQCYIIDMDHGMHINKKISEQENTVDKVIIGNNCWIASNVTVLRGSRICDGAVVGAKSLVKGVVESNSVVVGIPCKKIKMKS